MKNLFLFFLLFNSYQLYAQVTIRPEIQKLADELASHEVHYTIHDSELEGSPDSMTTLVKTFYKLSKNASDSELIMLTDHKKPIVRCYAFEALELRKNIDLYPIMLKHITDTASVQSGMGCFQWTGTVADHFISYGPLSQAQREEFDSILIFAPIVPKDVRPMAFRHIKPEDKYHERIREIYIKEKDLPALEALGKFRNPQDLDLINDALKDPDENIRDRAMIAVAKFPDTFFYSALIAIHKPIVEARIQNKFSCGCFYEALVQYKRPESRVIIERTLNTSNKKVLDAHAVAIWEALYDYPDPYFKGIQEHIKLSEEQKSRIRMFRSIP